MTDTPATAEAQGRAGPFRLDPVLMLTVAIAAVGAAVAWQIAGHGPPADAPFTIPLAAIVVGVVLVERYAVHLHFRGEAHSFTLGEVPIILGLFFAAPWEVVVGRALGAAILLLLVERQRRVKAAFNISLYLLETSLAALVWVALGGGEAGASTAAIGIGLLAAVTAGAVSMAAVWLVIGLHGRQFDVTELRSSLSVGVPISAANAAMTACVVVVAWLRPELAWLPLVPMVVLLGAYRAYVAERRHRDGLSFLYGLARDVNSIVEAGAALVHLLRTVSGYLRAETIELFLVPAGDQSSTLLSVKAGELVEARVPASDLPHVIRAAAEGDDLDPDDPRCAIAVAPLGRGITVVLRVRDPLADVEGFDRVASDVLGSVANLAATVVERADLEEMKTAFLSAVSHELRTPLAVVMGTASTLRHRGSQLRQDQTELLTERLEAHAQRLDRLLTDLLDIDRLARGVVEPRRREVDLSIMASRLVDALEVTSHPIKLYGTGVRADIDGPQVERIVENLVRNAVKYTPAGTPIEVSLQRLPDGVRIVVEDRGPGVPDIAKTSILEPFVRLDADHPSPGTGIGLSLVRRFAQLHGGDIEVKDRPGGGATFSVTLLDDRPDLMAPAPAAEQEAVEGSVVALRPPA